jgi:hypothetical protein
MNSQENENSSSSIIMDLENLQKEYSNLLISYKASVAEYVAYLNEQSQLSCSDSSNNKSNCIPELVSIQGQAYNGTGSAGQSNATTLQDCMASCASSQTCTGATFVSNKCLIRTGDSPLVPSSNDSYAIIPKGKQLLLNMENINQQLISVNQQLITKIKSSEPVYYEIDKETNIKNNDLIQSYEELIGERENIIELLNEYETLENTENQNQIKVTQNYYSYIFLIIFAVIIIILLYVIFGSSSNNTMQNIQTGGDLSKNTYYIVFGLILVIIFINYFTK